MIMSSSGPSGDLVGSIESRLGRGEVLAIVRLSLGESQLGPSEVLVGFQRGPSK